MSILDHYISLAKEKGYLVDIYRDHFDEETLFGNINAFSQDYLYMTIYNDEGEYNGVSIIRKNDVTRIRWGGLVRDSIARLVKRTSSTPAILPTEGSLKSILLSLQTRFESVAIYTEEIVPKACFIGQIVEFDDEHLVIHEYGTKDNLERSHILLGVSEITRIDVDDKYQRNLVFLHQSKSVPGK
jgi:hypothetical protein